MTRTIGRLAVVAALGAMLAACNTTSMVNATAPVSGTVTWVMYKSQSDLLAAYSTAPGRPKMLMGKLGSFETWDKSIIEGGNCTIHTLYPGGHPTEHAFGAEMAHALRHCVEGHFHPH